MASNHSDVSRPHFVNPDHSNVYHQFQLTLSILNKINQTL
nr:MAG TPA: hypothetical protein [Caudoviricetes sp.]